MLIMTDYTSNVQPLVLCHVFIVITSVRFDGLIIVKPIFEIIGGMTLGAIGITLFHVVGIPVSGCIPIIIYVMMVAASVTSSAKI